MEEDEDVIIQGASLHHHLKDTGFTDYEVSESQNFKKKLEKKLNYVQSSDKVGYHSVFKLIWNVIAFVLQIRQAENDFLKISAIKIIRYRLLQEEDLLALEHLSPTVQALALNQEWILDKEADSRILKMYSLFPPALNMLFSTFMWPALFLCLFSHYWIIGGNSFSRLTVLLFLSGVLISLRLIVIQKMNSAYIYFENILKLLDRSLKVLSQALKALNEVEILHSGMSRNGVNCPTNDYSAALVASIYQILETLSIASASGHSYLKDDESVVTRNNLLKIFDSRFMQSHELGRNRGEFYSLMEKELFSNLKMKRKLVASQLSAFLTELFMTLEMSEDFNRKSYIHLPKLIPSKELSGIEADISLLQRILVLSQNAWYGDGVPVLKETQLFTKKQFDIVGAIQALSLHTKSVITKVLELKHALDIEENKNINTNTTIDLVEKHYAIIKNELESCCGCLEEVFDRSKRLYKERLNDIIWDNEVSEIEKLNIVLTKNDDVELIGAEDRVIEDEFFEIITSDEKVIDDASNFDILLSHKQERVMKRHYQKQCKKVLQEIQPILQRKRDECERREEIAFKRIQCDNENINSAVPNDDITKNAVSFKECPHLSHQMDVVDLLSEEFNPPYDTQTSDVVEGETSANSSDGEGLKLYRKIREDLENGEKIQRNVVPNYLSYDYKSEKQEKILDWDKADDRCDNISNCKKFELINSNKDINSTVSCAELYEFTPINPCSENRYEDVMEGNGSIEEYIKEGNENYSIELAIDKEIVVKQSLISRVKNDCDNEYFCNVISLDAINKGRGMGMEMDEDIYGGFGERELEDCDGEFDDKD